MRCTVINKTNRIILVRQENTKIRLFPMAREELEVSHTADITVFPEETETLIIRKKGIKEIRSGRTFDIESARTCVAIPNFWFRLNAAGDCTVKILNKKTDLDGLRLLRCRFDLFSAESTGAEITSTDRYLNDSDVGTFLRGYRSLWIGDIINTAIFMAIAAWFCTLSVQHRTLLYLLPALLFLFLVFGSVRNLLKWYYIQKQLKENGSLDTELLQREKRKPIFKKK